LDFIVKEKRTFSCHLYLHLNSATSLFLWLPKPVVSCIFFLVTNRQLDPCAVDLHDSAFT